MTTFNTFSDTLPDPLIKVTDAGNYSGSGNPGPGFASVRLSSNKQTQVSRTISGRGVHRESGAHNWDIDISYNPMLREQFEPVSSFLMSRNSRLNPFYVVLPQYSRPRDPLFWNYAASNTIKTYNATPAGFSYLTIYSGSAFTGSAKPGDAFTITDPADSNHKKIYLITRVETNSNYQAGTIQPSTNSAKIWCNPPLVRRVSGDSVVNFIQPKFRVISKSDVQEYSLDTNNLYSFSLSLEEILP